MNYKNPVYFFLFLSLHVAFVSCGEKSTAGTSPEAIDNNAKKGENKKSKNLTSGKGSLSFRMNGDLYETDPERTKCWSTTTIPLAMMMARGNKCNVSWQMGYEKGKESYKIGGDSDGTINFTIGGKTFWTRKRGVNYLNINITSTKDKYSVILLSGTFEGVLEDKEGNKVEITEGRFVTEDI